MLAEKVATKSNSDWHMDSAAKLRDARSNFGDQLITLRAALRKPSMVPINYKPKRLTVDVWGHFYTSEATLKKFLLLAITLREQGLVAVNDGRPDEASQWFLDAIRLGSSIRYKGLLVDARWGMACSGQGIRQLHAHRNAFSSETCNKTIVELLSISKNVESFREFKERDRIWIKNATGWKGRLQLFADELTGEHYYYSDDDYLKMFFSEQAEMRLLVLELGLRAYYIDRKNWPVSLAELVPKYVPRIPKDPFDETNGIFRYRQLSEGYLLYSVGPNGTDDGGQPAQYRESSIRFHCEWPSGDLELESHFSDYVPFE